MIKVRFVVSTLSAIALFTMAALPAHAGGGMGTGSGVTTCRLILNGPPNQPQTVKLIDFGTAGDQVKVGSAVLLCDLPVVASTVSGPSTVGLTSTPNTVTCYSVSGADPARIGVTIEDPFTKVIDPPGTQSVQVGAIQLLCVPSLTTGQ